MSSKVSSLKVSGKKLSFAKTQSIAWKFEKRPGGWIVATHPNGSRHRFKIHLEPARDKMSFTTRAHSGMADIQRDSTGAARGSASVASIEADLTAQFPGKVRKILVSPGSAVKEGEPLLLVEAMKMEFAIKAPAAGIVNRFLVKEGQQLAPGDRFLEFTVEPSQSG